MTHEGELMALALIIPTMLLARADELIEYGMDGVRLDSIKCSGRHQ